MTADQGKSNFFNRIVVGTDGSETAKEAVDVAIALARENGGTLHLVNAYKSSSTTGQAAVAGAGIAAASPGLSAAIGAEASLHLLTAVAADIDGITVEIHSVNDSPPDAVLGVAAEVEADLIIVGNKGMERRVFGSVPNSIAHRAPCNLLIVKTT
jgi:nucleotide-binding universal stress UspA family protein